MLHIGSWLVTKRRNLYNEGKKQSRKRERRDIRATQLTRFFEVLPCQSRPISFDFVRCNAWSILVTSRIFEKDPRAHGSKGTRNWRIGKKSKKKTKRFCGNVVFYEAQNKTKVQFIRRTCVTSPCD